MMKMNKITTVIAVLAVMALMPACEKQQALKVQPVHEADYRIYSGKHTHQTTFKAPAKKQARRAEVFAYYKVQDGNVPAEYRDRIPQPLSYEERMFVLDYIRNHPAEHTQDFRTSVYFLQCVGSSYAYYTGSTLVDHNGAWHGVTGGNQMDYLTINGTHINDYNASWGPDALCVNLPLVDPTYHDSWGDKDNTKHDAWTVYAIPEHGYFLGFDYRTVKNSGEYYDGDGVYNDWVIRIIPLDAEHTTPEEPIVVPVEDASEGTPADSDLRNEVEVNLSLNAERPEGGDYISSKLSIHVRDTTDVEVYLPVPVKYYCQQSDLTLLHDYAANERVYSDYVQYATLDLNGQTVTMHVRFEENGIRVTTRGVNAEVLRYCRETYLDGITFEVWTYYRDTTREDLHLLLDQSEVAFTANPGWYVNAFGPVDGQPNPLDCTVTPPASFRRVGDEVFNHVYVR